MTVTLYDPLAHLEGQTQTMDGGPRLAVALGVALAHGQGLDLKPQERKALRLKTRARWLVASSVFGAVVVAALVYLGLSVVALHAGRQVRVAQREWAPLEPTYRHSMALAHQTKQLEGIVLAAQRFLDSQPLWEGIFKELGQLIPANIELTDLSATSTEMPQALPLHLRGTGALTSAVGDGTLAQFLDALESSVFFQGVHLASSHVSTDAVKAMTFEVVCRLE
jgi:Tfp pilus assembly protein PilN